MTDQTLRMIETHSQKSKTTHQTLGMVGDRYQNVKKGQQTLNMVRADMKSVDQYQNGKIRKFFQVSKLLSNILYWIFSKFFFNTWKFYKFFPAQTSIEHFFQKIFSRSAPLRSFSLRFAPLGGPGFGS